MRRPFPRQRRKQARPGEIMAAALAIFNAKGFAASKIDDVAHAAGVTKGTVYLYFSSKEELFKAAIRETVLPNLERIKTATFAEIGARTRLRTALTMWAASLRASPGSLTKLMIAEAGNFPELAGFYREEVGGRLRQMLVEIVEYGIARSEFRPCDASTVTRALCAPILFSHMLRHTLLDPAEQQPDLVELAESLIAVVIDGISATTEEKQ